MFDVTFIPIIIIFLYVLVPFTISLIMNKHCVHKILSFKRNLDILGCPEFGNFRVIRISRNGDVDLYYHTAEEVYVLVASVNTVLNCLGEYHSGSWEKEFNHTLKTAERKAHSAYRKNYERKFLPLDELESVKKG